MAGFSSQDKITLTSAIDCPDFKIVEKSDDELRDIYELDRCIDWVTKHSYQKTCLQFPPLLLNDGILVSLYLEEKLKKKFFILADTSFGSCCVDNISSEHVDADSIIHFGHACLSQFSKLPVLYIFEKRDLDVDNFISAMNSLISNKSTILIFYDVIYHHLFNTLKDLFKDQHSVEVSRISLPNCDFDKDKEVKCFARIFDKHPENNITGVFIGEDCAALQNLFLTLSDFTWYQYTEDTLKPYDLNRCKFLMKKYHQIELVKDAEVLGILIGTLGIENYLNAIERIKLLAKNNGKKCYILAVGKPNVSKLANFPEIDVFVSVACIENLSKDFKDYYKPIVSLFEVEMALGKHEFQTQYSNDFSEVLTNYSTSSVAAVPQEGEVSLISGKIRATGNHFAESENSLELQEKQYGALVETKGAKFLSNRSWKGLETDTENKEVTRAEIGRTGIPVGYENEFDTLKQTDSKTS